jgi:hypothetical protein
LQYEHVFAADVVEQFDHDFAVAKAADGGAPHLDVEMANDFLGQPGVGIAGKYHHVAIGQSAILEIKK